VVWSDGSLHSDNGRCETPEEKTARLTRELELKAEEAKRQAQREATKRKIHRGFESETDFIFSDDFRFILQKATPPQPSNSGVINWGSIVNTPATMN